MARTCPIAPALGRYLLAEGAPNVVKPSSDSDADSAQTARSPPSATGSGSRCLLEALAGGRHLRDQAVTRQLPSYKELDPKWHDWAAVTAVIRRLAQDMLR